jgi:hypothetical protein
MTTFEKINFLLSKKSRCPLKNLFSDDAFIHIKRPLDANACLRIQNEKSIHCPSIFKISIQQQNKWKIKHVLVAKILPPTNVPPLGYGPIYCITLGPIENCKQCEVMISEFPVCICMDFVSLLIGSLGSCGE